MSDIASRVKAIIVDKLGVDENEVVTEARPRRRFVRYCRAYNGI